MKLSLPNTNLNDYEKLKIIFEYQSRAYSPPKKIIEGDFTFRFPKHTFILRAKDKNSILIVDGPAENIILDFSINDIQAFLKIITKEISPLRLLLDKKLKINSKIDLKFFYRLFYFLACFTNFFYRKIPHAEIKSSKVNDRIKKILILQGSPRIKSGYTQAYLDCLIEGLNEKRVTIDIFYIYETKIEYCAGCFSCWMVNPGRCIFDDDMNKIISKINDADLVLFAFPIYILGMPGKLKTMIDRLINLLTPQIIRSRHKGLLIHKRHTPRKQSLAGLIICGLPEKKHFISVNTYLEDFADFMSMSFLGNINIPNAIETEISPLSAKLKTADYLRKIGNHLFSHNTLNKKLVQKIIKVRSPNQKKWAIMSDAFFSYWALNKSNSLTYSQNLHQEQ